VVPPGEYPGYAYPEEYSILEWDNPEKSNRLIALWKAIASRYKDEPIIAGYDILNEPHLNDQVYQSLFSGMIEGIRSVDPNHLIIIDPNYLSSEYVLFSDANLMYDFHFYYPLEYTYQTTPFSDYPELGSYPNDDIIIFPKDLTWYTATFNNPGVTQDADWAYYEGEIYTVSDPKIIAGRPVMNCQLNGQGTIYFDDFTIKEYEENGQFLSEIASVQITSDTDVFTETDGRTWCYDDEWCYWSDGNTVFELSTTEGYGDNASLSVNGTANLANWNNNRLRFQVTQGHSYQISGWIKGVNMGENEKGKFQIDFETSSSGLQVTSLNKQALANEMLRIINFGKVNNFQMFCGEFSVWKDLYENHGGLNWVKDVLDLLKEHHIHYTYFSYHDGVFGIYTNPVGLPDPLYMSTELFDLLVD
jgi:endoglucanase